jgi:hypothetical protein
VKEMRRIRNEVHETETMKLEESAELKRNYGFYGVESEFGDAEVKLRSSMEQI